MIAPQGTTGPTRLAPGLVAVDDPMALAREAAERFAAIAEEACAGAGRFTVALAGGSTPKSLYALLASAPYRSCIPWSQAHVFWGKAPVLQEVLEGPCDPERLPAQLIRPTRGRVVWLVDRAAATRLAKQGRPAS